jgi:hypothetical protein
MRIEKNLGFMVTVISESNFWFVALLFKFNFKSEGSFYCDVFLYSDDKTLSYLRFFHCLVISQAQEDFVIASNRQHTISITIE